MYLLVYWSKVRNIKFKLPGFYFMFVDSSLKYNSNLFYHKPRILTPVWYKILRPLLNGDTVLLWGRNGSLSGLLTCISPEGLNASRGVRITPCTPHTTQAKVNASTCIVWYTVTVTATHVAGMREIRVFVREVRSVGRAGSDWRRARWGRY